jgi:cobalt-zinc-cadmium efflux system membrane fusion protein
MKKQILIPIIGLLALQYIFTACKQAAPTEEGQEAVTTQHAHKDTIEEVVDDLVITSRQFKAAGIELGKLEKTSLTGSIKVSGKLEVPPQNQAGISAYVGGIIKSIQVSAGSYVRKGQTVMTLEHPDFLKLQEEYTSAKSNMVFLEQEYQRKKELLAENATSQKSFQEAESKYNIEKGRLSSLTSQLSMLGISTTELNKGNITNQLSLRSPINGYITQIHGSMGAYAEPNKMLFEVVDNSNILVRLDVYERDFYQIKKGQKISILLPNQGNAEIEGRIATLGKAMDNTTKSIAVYAEIRNNKRQDLIPGIFVNALIYVDGHAASVVPTETVVRSGEKQYVFIVNTELCSKPNIPGKDPHSVKDANGNTIPLAYKMVEVRTGAEGPGVIEINPAKDIMSVDQLVVKGGYFLMSALKSGETVGCCAPAEEEKKE